jgi:hypothetical protein
VKINTYPANAAVRPKRNENHLRKPRNRPAAHIVAAANLGKRFVAVIAALDGLALLVIGSACGPSSLQFALELGCEFLDVYFQRAMSYPMVAYCDNEETARSAIFLFGFAENAKQ